LRKSCTVGKCSYICPVIEPTEQTMKDRMTAADGCKILKATLSKTFPGTKFSVRGSRGTGHGYVTVSYDDGPAFDDVRVITDGFEGSGFDGMIDMEYSVDTCYCPVHGARFAGTPGTHSSMGSVPATGIPELHEHNTLCCEKGRIVDFGLRGVSVTRHLSVDATLAAVDCYNEAGNPPVKAEVKDGYQGHKYAEVSSAEENQPTPWLTPHYAEYVRKADLRDFVKLAKAAEAERQAKAEEYRTWRAKYDAEQAAKLKGDAQKEVSGEQNEYRWTWTDKPRGQNHLWN
jgi:hypothetical protein